MQRTFFSSLPRQRHFFMFRFWCVVVVSVPKRLGGKVYLFRGKIIETLPPKHAPNANICKATQSKRAAARMRRRQKQKKPLMLIKYSRSSESCDVCSHSVLTKRYLRSTSNKSARRKCCKTHTHTQHLTLERCANCSMFMLFMVLFPNKAKMIIEPPLQAFGMRGVAGGQGQDHSIIKETDTQRSIRK